MRAIILVAGTGTRMGALTERQHKSLLEVDGRPLLVRLVDDLTAVGVTEVVLATGHRADEVVRCVRQAFPTLVVHEAHNPRYATTNNIVSLQLALEQAERAEDVDGSDDDLLLVEGDLVLDRTILTRVAGCDASDVAVVDRFGPDMDGTVVRLDGDRISDIIPPHLQDPGDDLRWAYKTVNVYRLSAASWRDRLTPLLRAYAEHVDERCYYELILGMLIYGGQLELTALDVEGASWAELDTPDDLAAARRRFAAPEGDRPGGQDDRERSVLHA